jgi:DNA-binding beta-propeller fold protein YncE
MGAAHSRLISSSTIVTFIATIPSGSPQGHSVTTVAGVVGSAGSTNGIGTNAKFNFPFGLDISPDGSFALVADTYNHLIRQIVLSSSAVTTVAGVAGSFGSTNGIGTNAKFYIPRGVDISPDGSFALVADYYNHLIRQIVLSSSAVTTVAGVARSLGSTNGIGTNAKLNQPFGAAISPDGSFALVADTDNHLIRQIVLSSSVVTTVAGVAGSSGSTNGIGTNAKFYYPAGVAISPDGSFALVAEYDNDMIRQIVLSSSAVTTVAGVAGSSGSTNGIGTNAKFDYPHGIDISPDGSFALVADTYNYLIRQIVLSSSAVTTVAGVAGSFGSTNGIGTNAKLNQPRGVAISPDGSFALVVDYGNHLIREVLFSWDPAIAPTPQPSFLPTYQPSGPTSQPTSQPSLLPTITFQPTTACPPGHFLKVPHDPTRWKR